MISLKLLNFSIPDKRFWNDCFALRHISFVVRRWDVRGMSTPGLGCPISPARFRVRPVAAQVSAASKARSGELDSPQRQARHCRKLWKVESWPREKIVLDLTQKQKQKHNKIDSDYHLPIFLVIVMLKMYWRPGWQFKPEHFSINHLGIVNVNITWKLK